MLRRFRPILLPLFLLLVWAISARAGLPQPFWKEKPELLKKIREDRAVVVSAKTEKLENSDAHRFSVAGVGEVSKPLDFCFNQAQAYERLPQVSEHFKTAIYDANTRELSLLTQALGYQARMIIHIVPGGTATARTLTWEVVWGKFKGMHGIFSFEKIADRKTEISVVGEFEAKTLPLPKILMGFALEVVVQKVAEKMRSYLEDLAEPRPEPGPEPGPEPAPTQSSMILKSDVSDHSP